MLFRFFFLLILCLPAPVWARDLPQGEFVALGLMKPLIEGGIVGSIHAHANFDGQWVHWTFVTEYFVDGEHCAQTGRCSRKVQSLSHRVAWGDDGRLTLLESQRKQGPRLTVVESAADDILHSFVDQSIHGGVLRFDDNGGSLVNVVSGGYPIEARLRPATLADLDTLFALYLLYETSDHRRDHCMFEQLLVLNKRPDPSAVEADLLLAIDFMRHLLPFREAVYMEPKPGVSVGGVFPPKSTAWNFNFTANTLAHNLAIQIAKAAANGETVSDQTLLDRATVILDQLSRKPDPDMPVIRDYYLRELRDELLARSRIDAHVMQLGLEGNALAEALCKDLTLGR